MMHMKGNNRLVLNPATVNRIVTEWYNAHTIADESGKKQLEFSRLDDNMFTFTVKGADNED